MATDVDGGCSEPGRQVCCSVSFTGLSDLPEFRIDGFEALLTFGPAKNAAF